MRIEAGLPKKNAESAAPAIRHEGSSPAALLGAFRAVSCWQRPGQTPRFRTGPDARSGSDRISDDRDFHRAPEFFGRAA